MAQVVNNAKRRDPYKDFKFRVKVDGRVVAGVSKVSKVKRTTEVVGHREGGDPSSSHKSSPAPHFESITLERGVTHDAEFETWLAGASNPKRSGRAGEMAADLRRDMVIETMNEAGEVVSTYRVAGGWVSAFQALPSLDADAKAVAIESITFQHEGLERHAVAAAPAKPIKK